MIVARSPHVPSSPAAVLIGPAAAGKSTLGALLAERLVAAFVDLDEIGGRYYAEVGWSIARLARRTAEIGRVAAEREWEPARAHAVRRVVGDHPDAVIALGAGHTSYTDASCVAAVHDALSTTPHVLLVLPFADRDRALCELRRRSIASKGTDWISSGHDLLAEWLDDAATRSLATKVVVTDGANPQTIADRLACRSDDRPG